MHVINRVIIIFDTLEADMDIDNMKAFVSVAELKSLSAAAVKLNHLQSNMTAKIKKSKPITDSSFSSECQRHGADVGGAEALPPI